MKHILKKTKHPILSMIQNNQEYGQNTLVQLNTTQITLEPNDIVSVKDNYLIVGDEKEPTSIINLNQVIFVSDL